MGETILNYLWQALSATFLQILILLGPGLVLTVILNYETAFVQNRAVNSIGRGWYLGLFGWLGTIIHELGHALFCLIFLHKITKLELFHPDPETGTLGYVAHAYNRANIYQLVGNFFIGIGPILLGMGVISLIAFWLLGLNPFSLGNDFSFPVSQLNSWEAFKGLFQGLWNASVNLFAEIFSIQHLSSWQLYVFIYLVFAIGSSITLSPPDIKTALGGFIAIVVVILLFNLATMWAGNYLSNMISRIAGYYALFYTIAFLIMLINLIVVFLLLLPAFMMKKKPARAA